MEFKKLNAPSLKELFVNELQNMILSGKLEIGSKLPPERELAESMKVSRAVINSGIAELEKKGFLVVRPRIGTFVADYRRDGSLDTLVAIMNYNGETHVYGGSHPVCDRPCIGRRTVGTSGICLPDGKLY